MIKGNKVVVVMPAYNAANTLEKTYKEIDFNVVDQVILVDDASQDNTVEIADKLRIKTIVHFENKGYGGNQKTCYRTALKQGADIIVMLHPDYQYTPKLIGAMANLVASGLYDIILGSRILTGDALKGGMPRYKYIFNRLLTFIENLFLGQKLSEYHTGYRAFHRRVLENLPLEENSDNFVFDNQLLAQAIFFNFKIGEISCPTYYFKDASSINLRQCIKYGLGVLCTSVQFLLQRIGIKCFSIFNKEGKKLKC
ncbi:MAG: glycosyltransferase family 2 protein [Promethearchaeota archaeon]